MTRMTRRGEGKDSVSGCGRVASRLWRLHAGLRLGRAWKVQRLVQSLTLDVGRHRACWPVRDAGWIAALGEVESKEGVVVNGE